MSDESAADERAKRLVERLRQNPSRRTRGARDFEDEIDRLHAENTALRAEMGRLNRILAALLEHVRGAYECAHMPVFKGSDEIRRLRDENAALTAAIERVRAACENELRWVDAQPILRALEETP